ncbi:MAG: TAT-variant-translocated molybdopterin oxidoreductase [Deltaproteobacteria bacterium]|nr:TAT-variant-translocated molybdopterin oxidoreductase [Deltaproteobacteria bacterium]
MAQLESDPEFRTFVEREFQDGQSEMKDPVSRRNFLKLMGASAGLAGMAACRRPVEHILPYAKQPEDLVPGKPQFYATVLPIAGEAIGALVEAHEGRPTKIEGNPAHPASRGGTDTFVQAAVLGLYDPDRSGTPTKKNAASKWAEWNAFASPHFAGLVSQKGAGLAILSEAMLSPTLMRLRADVQKSMPEAKWYTWEPIHHDHEKLGTKLAFGKPMRAHYDLKKADVIVALDADILGSEEGNVAHSKDFATRRQPDGQKMSRLYAIEGNFTVTGAAADHRLRVRPSQVHTFARALVAELQKQGLTLPAGVAADFGTNAADASKQTWDSKKPFLQALAGDLIAAKGSAVIVAGRGQAPEVHAIAAVLNAALGNVSNVVTYSAAIEEPTQTEQIKALAMAMGAKQVTTLVILGGNPVFDAPAELKFGDKLASVTTSIHLSPYLDETGAKTTWSLPRAHALESWGDAVGSDGTISVQQPLILPLLGGKSDIEIVAQMTGSTAPKGYELVRETLKTGFVGADFEKAWRRALHAGVVEGSAQKPTTAPTFAATVNDATKAKAAASGFDLVFVPSASVWDGRFANNPWLQELPDPMTKLTWDNAALVSPAAAQKLGVTPGTGTQFIPGGDLVKITTKTGSVEAAVWVQPGLADDTVVIALGYGRTAELSVASGAGFNVYPLRSSDAQWLESGAKVEKAAGAYSLANTQDHHFIAPPTILGSVQKPRPVVREATLDEYKKDPRFADKQVPHPPLVSLFKERAYEGHAWAMSIDLSTCTGCNVCTIACQAENNIPVVGKDQVRRGREMHWIRLDRYFANQTLTDASEIDTANPRVVHQPMACHHCENAPCEQVCPVTATPHSPEGLNDMQYSRCIGTRYCANNCPYKVRRFNFLAFHEKDPEVRAMAHNPDVTVRMRGVMEKCSYCVQRINKGKIAAKLENRKVKDGDVVPACAQACPSDAIVFGDMNDPQSRVSKLRKEARRYDLLAELNTKPRTTYLARVRNPHPQLG